jgi:geranyl diphosphate synthase
MESMRRDAEHPAAQSWADVGQSPLDPFSLVADEISSVSERLRRTIMSDIPVLSKAAEYFFQASVETSSIATATTQP